jgi:hypothetical protein
MADIDLDFKWERDVSGYELVGPTQQPVVVAGQLVLTERLHIIPKGGRLETYRPLKVFPPLYREFAKVADPSSALAFVKKFGPMTNLGQKRDWGDDVNFFLRQAKNMRHILAAYSKGGGSGPVRLRDFEIVLKFTDGRLRFQLVPRGLLEALWLQLGLTFLTGASVKTCLHCGQFFEAGPGTGRRLDATFCSDAHRVTFNSLARTRR